MAKKEEKRLTHAEQLAEDAKDAKRIEKRGPEYMQFLLDENRRINAPKPKANPLAAFMGRTDYGISAPDSSNSPKLSPLSIPLPQLTEADDVYGMGKMKAEPEMDDNFDAQSVPLKVGDNLPVDLSRPNANAGIPPEFGNPINDLSKYIARPAEPEINQVLNPATSQLDVKDTSRMVGTDESGGEYPQEEEDFPLNETAEQAALDTEGASSKLGLVGGADEQAPLDIPQTQGQAPSRFEDQLGEAREQDRKHSLLMGLLKASQMGLSATGGTKLDTSYADAELAKGNQAVNRLKTDEEMKQEKKKFMDQDMLRDPNSSASQQARDIARKVGLKISDQTTAKELSDAGLPIGTLLTQKLAIDARTEDSKLKREAMDVTKTEKKEVQGEKQNLEVQKTVDKMVNNLRTSDDFKTYQATKSAQAALDSAIASGNKTETGSAFMLYAKIAQGDNSVVRESDMKNLAGTYNYSSPTEMFSKLSAKAAGGNFSADELQQMKKVAMLIQSIKSKHVREQLEPIQTRIKNHGLDPDETISPEITREFSSTLGSTTIPKEKKTMALPKAQAPGTTIRQKSTGKTFKVNTDGQSATEI